MHRNPAPLACLLALMALLASCQEEPASVRAPRPAGETLRIATIDVGGDALKGEPCSLRIPDLEEIGVVALDTQPPGAGHASRFTGVLIGDLVDALAPQATAVLLNSMDDYQVRLTREDWHGQESMLATQREREHLTTRSQGPARLVFKLGSTASASRHKWIGHITKIEFVK